MNRAQRHSQILKLLAKMAIECRFMSKEIIKDVVRWQKREEGYNFLFVLLHLLIVFI
jgi:hypothetical protein